MDCAIVPDAQLLISLYLAHHLVHLFPNAEKNVLRLLYIDDALLASALYLDRDCVPLLPTEAPHGKLASCGLGMPGGWLSLEHRLRDVDRHARAVGMCLNVKKTNLLLINPTHKVSGNPIHSN